MPEGGGHSHASAALHGFATTGLSLVARLDPGPPADDAVGAALRPPALGAAADPRVGALAPPVEAARLDGGASGARFGELDVRGDRAYLAIISSPTGVAIADVRDPASPRFLGDWAAGTGGYVTDVKAASDGRHFYASVQNAGASGNGIHLVDALDPANPVRVAFAPVASQGVHMMWVHTVGDVDFVYGATGFGPGTPVFASRVGDGGARSLVRAGTFDPASEPHDVAVFEDALAGKTLMAVANGPDGVVIADLTDPAAPAVLGRWAYDGTPRFYAHTIRAGVVEGRRIVLVSPEGGALGIGSGDVARLWVLDATDPGDIRVLGSWQNPGNHRSGSFTLSTHNFQWVEGRVYLAHYHGGVWVLRAETLADLAAPTALAYRLPNAHTAGNSVPYVWDVVLSRGYTMALDGNGGLYVLHFACDATGPSGPTSYG